MGGTLGPTNGIDGHHSHVTQLSLVATNKGAELFVQISQEVIDLSVFTVSLKIEACKLESYPAKHILRSAVKTVHPLLPQRVDKFLGLAVILLFLWVDAQGYRVCRVGELMDVIAFSITDTLRAGWTDTTSH